MVKWLSSKGAYDDYIENEEDTIENNKIEEKSKRHQDTNQRLQIIVEANNIAIKEELRGNQELMKRIVEAELEVGQELINKWKDEEVNKIKTGQNKNDNT